MTAPSSHAAESDHKRAWRALVDRIKGGEAAAGERLYLLGAGPVPVDGAVGGALTLDAAGGVVLVVALTDPAETSAGQIARQLEAVGRLPGANLREAGVDPAEGGGLARRHAAFFELDDPVELNARQRCAVVLGAEPAGADRAALEGELGDSLGGLFVLTAEGVAPVAGVEAAEAEAPEAEIVLEPEAPAEEVEAPEGPEAEAEAPEAEVEAAEEVEAEAPEAEVDAAEEAEAEAPPETEAEAPADEAEAEGPASIEAAIDSDDGTGERAAAVVVEDRGQVAEADRDAGPDLVAPYLDDETTTIIVEESDEPVAAEALDERTGRFAGWPVGNWIGLTMILVGLTIGVIGVFNLRKGDPDPAPPEETNDQITVVASGVTPDATHARWIGQQRVVTLADGTLVFVYPTEDSLNLVKDGADGGATWQDPFVLEDVVGAQSLSVDVDSKDRLHVAYSDGASVNYVRLKNKPAGWKPSRLIQIDDDTTSLQVDLAWDERNQTAHVVWVQQNDEGEAPAWAALTNEGGIHLNQQGVLTSPAQDVAVLVSIAADARSSLLVAYRRGDQLTGWSSRYSAGRSPDGRWLFEEEEEIPQPGFAGAADVVYDRQKTAHLILRDDDAYNLTYFSKTRGEPWSGGEVAHHGVDIDAVEFPTLTYNSGDDNLYLFFQTQQYYDAGEVAYVVRPLNGEGWQGPFQIMGPADVPEGGLYPVAPERVTVQAIAFWTKTGDPYEVQSAPVRAPTEAEETEGEEEE